MAIAVIIGNGAVVSHVLRAARPILNGLLATRGLQPDTERNPLTIR
jgi:hypothetical protein